KTRPGWARRTLSRPNSEGSDHPWFVGVQFHPEYKSTVANPHPLFVNFVKAAIEVGKLVH
ncbi:MAG TPA: hypothetical protein VLB84_05300, partial [Bacteroidia bacterium]|nr:hypothetical protein [Bacteroidia bacterium]